ncbi:MAG: hypothetical protein J0M04_23860 [Verrucomicrobia bacterium]|nr:hypothetical protein [Verrucomicrobiota bacterium]
MFTVNFIRPAALAWVVGAAPLPLWAWTPGTYPAGGSGFAVDTQVRNDVVSFWHGVYQASEGYWNNHGWTGNYTATSPYDSGVGTTASVFVTDTERRINFYRALCGVPANVVLNTSSTVSVESGDSQQPAASTLKSAAAQRSAYMLIRTWGYYDGTLHPPLGNSWSALSHSPVQASCVAWTTAAWNANYRGNLAIGYFGPGAVDAYMLEETGTGASTSEWNSDVGHRRWLLYPPSTNMATGDTPGQFVSSGNVIRVPTNVIYVHQRTAELASVTPKFTSFPPAGYFPAPLNSTYWSLTYPGADFTNATVAMTTSGGSPVSATVVKRNGVYGDPALVWQVASAASVKSVTADTTFNVTVSGIAGTGVPTSASYSVTLINPDQITSDLSVYGPASASVTAGATYTFAQPASAEAVQVNSFQATSSALAEGAEDATSAYVISNTTGSYALLSTCSFSSDPGFTPLSGAGTKSFNLTFPISYDLKYSGPAQQSFELDRDILPGSGAKLNFKYQRGNMSPGSNLVVESSNDAGLTWTQLGTAITGNATGQRDTTVTTTNRDLTSSATPVRVRFRYYLTAGQGAYTVEQFPTYPTGIFIDDISTTNCQWLVLKKSNDIAAGATSLALTSTTAGVTPANNTELRLRMRTKLGNRWMPYGSQKTVTYSSSAQTSAPVFSIASGSYPSGQAITITGDSGSTIYYRANGGAEQSASSPVTGLSVPAYPSTLSITAYATKTAHSGSALATATYSSTPFLSWAGTAFSGVTDATVIGAAADPDKDGKSNLLEFALGGDPDAASDTGVVRALTNDGSDTPKLLLTIAVRSGAPAFSGTPSPSSTVDGITYTILGGLTPSGTTSAVSVVSPQTSGLPAAPAGYEYRTFKLDAADGLPSKGFMRVKVTGSF